jgi:large subunit ribosomal protein L3
MGHGSKYHRRSGSLGALGPNHVFKGRPLPGRMGGLKITVQNLQVVKVDAEKNLLLVKGSVPGPNKSMITIKSAVKAK